LQNEYSLFFVTIDFINWSPVIEDNVAYKFNIKLKTWGAWYRLTWIYVSLENKAVWSISVIVQVAYHVRIQPRLLFRDSKIKEQCFMLMHITFSSFFLYGSDRLYFGYLDTKYWYRTLKGNHLLLLYRNIGIQACLLAWKWKSSISFLGFFFPLLSLHQTMRDSWWFAHFDFVKKNRSAGMNDKQQIQTRQIVNLHYSRISYE